MHPDIVDKYNYIFLWDEDLGVQHFNAQRLVKTRASHLCVFHLLSISY